MRSTGSYPLLLNWPNIVLAALSGDTSSLTTAECDALDELKAERPITPIIRRIGRGQNG